MTQAKGLPRWLAQRWLPDPCPLAQLVSALLHSAAVLVPLALPCFVYGLPLTLPSSALRSAGWLEPEASSAWQLAPPWLPAACDQLLLAAVAASSLLLQPLPGVTP